MYCEANKSKFNFVLRRFQAFFTEHEKDLGLIKGLKKPNREKQRRQGKVEYQGSMGRFTPQQKLDLIRQYDEEEQRIPNLRL